mgnify:FL=1
MLDEYNVRDVGLVVHPANDTDPNIWNVLYQFQNNGELSTATNRMSVAYTVYDSGGNVIAAGLRFDFSAP